MKNKIALKRGIYSIILSIVFIVAVILINILSTALADRYPLDIDLTTDGIHTMSSDNVDYIKSVDKDVNIYVCLPEDAYVGSGSGYNMHYYAATYYFVDYNPSTHGNYFSQTAEMLKKYNMYNDHIKITYLDVTQPSANETTEAFDDFTWSIGDILIESTFVVDGKSVTRRTALPFNEIYSLDSENPQVQDYFDYYMSGYAENYALYGYGIGYSITENNIENALSSAIYKVTSESTPVYLVPSTYCKTETVSKLLEQTLTSNNFSIQYTEGLIASLLEPGKYDNYAGVILSDCTSDISEDDRAALDKFLANDGKRGKSLFYFAGTNTYKLKNLCGLLGDWGIGFKEGLLYETYAQAHLTDEPTNIYLASLNTDYTKVSNALAGRYHLAKNIIPMIQLYPTSTTATYARKTTVLLRTATAGTTTIMPIDADVKTWKPASNAEYDAFPMVIYSEDEAILDNNYVYSGVIAFASQDYISGELANSPYMANIQLTLDTFNKASGVAETPFSFVAKKITAENYKALVTEGKTRAIKIIFMAIIPIVLIVVGLFVWIWRKRK